MLETIETANVQCTAPRHTKVRTVIYRSSLQTQWAIKYSISELEPGIRTPECKFAKSTRYHVQKVKQVKQNQLNNSSLTDSFRTFKDNIMANLPPIPLQ